MRYLVTTESAYAPFVTNYFDAQNHFIAEIGMVVYDLHKLVYTTDGVNWLLIEEDHL
jgi:hypothetical protein